MKKLGLSIVSLVVSLISLIGVTYAWAKVNMIDTDDFELEISGETLKFVVDGNKVKTLTEQNIIDLYNKQASPSENGNVNIYERIRLEELSSPDNGLTFYDVRGRQYTKTLGRPKYFDLDLTLYAEAETDLYINNIKDIISIENKAVRISLFNGEENIYLYDWDNASEIEDFQEIMTLPKGETTIKLVIWIEGTVNNDLNIASLTFKTSLQFQGVTTGN